MPHMVALIRHANRAFDQLDPDMAAAAREAVTSARTLGEAVDRAGLADRAAVDADAAAVRSALDGLPGSVAAALLAVLRDAATRDVPVVLQWKPGAHAELQVWEALDGGVGQVGVLVISPYGRDLAATSSA